MLLYPMLLSHWLGQCQERGLTWDKVALQLNSRLPRELTAEVCLLASADNQNEGHEGGSEWYISASWQARIS